MLRAKFTISARNQKSHRRVRIMFRYPMLSQMKSIDLRRSASPQQDTNARQSFDSVFDPNLGNEALYTGSLSFSRRTATDEKHR